MVQIGRAVEGITINGKEWLLDSEGNIMTFFSIKEAKIFLIKNGFEEFNEDELENYFVFEELEFKV